MSAQPFSPNSAYAQSQQAQQSPSYQAYQTPPLRPTRAKKTVPMDYHLPLSESTQIATRNLCGRCHGHGHVSGREMRCRVCNRRMSHEQIEEYGTRKGFVGRWVELPCKHSILAKDIRWMRPQCEVCQGEGLLTRWVSWREFMETLYPDIDDEQTTAALRVLSQASQASQAHHRDAFARSGEPTVTAPPQSPLYHVAGTITPNLGTNILEFDQRAVSPHLPPYSPESDRSF